MEDGRGERGFYNEQLQIPIGGNFFARSLLSRVFPRPKNTSNVLDKNKRPARFSTPPLDESAPIQSSSKTFRKNTMPVPVQPNVTLPKPPTLAPLNLWNEQPVGSALTRQPVVTFERQTPEQEYEDDFDLDENAGDFDYHSDSHDSSDSGMMFYSPVSSRSSSLTVSRTPSVDPSIRSRSPSPVVMRPVSPILFRRSPRKNKGIGPVRYGSPIPIFY